MRIRESVSVFRGEPGHFTGLTPLHRRRPNDCPVVVRGSSSNSVGSVSLPNLKKKFRPTKEFEYVTETVAVSRPGFCEYLQ